MRRCARLVIAVCAISPMGCGTFSDAISGPAGPGFDHAYYRGVRFDAMAIRDGAYYMALDLPLSAVADTVRVPFIAYERMRTTLASVSEDSTGPLWPEP